MKWLAIGLSLLLVGEVVDAVAVPPAPWWSGITVVGILSVLGGLSVFITSIIAAWRSGQAKTAVEAVAQVNAVQTSKLTEIKTLVDGGKSELLQELAEIRTAVAAKSGLPADQVAAASAQRKYDDQAARVEDAAAEAAAGKSRRADDKPEGA